MAGGTPGDFMPMPAQDTLLAHDIARAMMDGFNRHYRLFRAESARAKHRFETADWLGQQRAQRERIRSEEHTSELQSPCNLVCRLLLEKKKIRHVSHCRVDNDELAIDIRDGILFGTLLSIYLGSFRMPALLHITHLLKAAQLLLCMCDL